jgi:hypothetical protein
MGLPTTTTGPTNVYQLIDDYGVSAGPAGGQAGSASGNPITLVKFTAPTIAAAAQVGYIISSALQRPVRLVTCYGASPPWTLIVGLGANTALTSVPSGIGY